MGAAPRSMVEQEGKVANGQSEGLSIILFQYIVADDSSLHQAWKDWNNKVEQPKFKNQAWRGDKSRAEHRVHCGE